MRLLYCPLCLDAVGLARLQGEVMSLACCCGASHIQWLADQKSYILTGVLIELHQPSLQAALKHQPKTGPGKTFKAVVLPRILTGVAVQEQAL